MELIRVERVSKRFKKVRAVSEASFHVEEGAIFGVVGSDGSGKTTLLRMVAAMTPPSEGRILVGGFDTVSQRAGAKRLMGYMPQRFGLYTDLTVRENIDFFLDIHGVAGPERSRRREEYLRFSNLTPFMDRRAGDLSGGMKQKLGLACVLVGSPKILVLDEPTNGVDPVSRREFWEILTKMRKGRMSILVSTSYLDEGEKCDRLILMHASRVLAEATPGEFRSHHASLEEAMISRLREAMEDPGRARQ